MMKSILFVLAASFAMAQPQAAQPAPATPETPQCRVFLSSETDGFEAMVVGNMLTTLEHDVRQEGFRATLTAVCRPPGADFYFTGVDADYARGLCLYVRYVWGFYKCEPQNCDAEPNT
jgi:hypothetical protein